MVESNRVTPRERRRAEEDAGLRRRRIDVALGAGGVALLFASALGTILAPSLALVPFIILEIAALALIVFSFARLRGPMASLRRPPE